MENDKKEHIQNMIRLFRGVLDNCQLNLELDDIELIEGNLKGMRMTIDNYFGERGQ